MSEFHNSSTNSKVKERKITLRIQATIIGVLLVSMVWVVLPSTLTFSIPQLLPTAAFATVNGGGVTCEGETATIVGTNGNNDITGTSGNDVIAGLGGNDRIRALGGNDIVCGGAGNDDMDGGEGRDELVGAAGNDRANGGTGNDICSAEREISCDEPDTTAPVITVPEDITEEATSAEGAVVNFEVSAEDDVDGQVEVSCDPESGSTFPVGTTTVTCTATDAAGNEATETFTVTVTPLPDTTAPTIDVPEDITVPATSAQGAQVTFTVTAQDDVDGTATLDGNGLTQDNVGGDIDINCTLPPGTTFTVGSTTVQCIATDAAGNEATGTFNVTVNAITCQGEPASIVGTPGDDVGINAIIGTESRDVIAALDGADQVRGQGGNDLICGDGGNDAQLIGGTGDDEIYGGVGNDRIFGVEGNDSMFGEAGDDFLGDENVGNDIMSGGAGDDLLDSTDAVVNNDNLDGGDGTNDICQSDPDPEVNCESNG
jgi:Ca2+-binding RTX toxin-like protein